jgi:hypothetical protein
MGMLRWFAAKLLSISVGKGDLYHWLADRFFYWKFRAGIGRKITDFDFVPIDVDQTNHLS